MPDVILPRPFDAYRGQEPYLFISYAHKDANLVYPELRLLKEMGYRIWYDEGIDPGNEWPEEVASAIKRCSTFLVFISPNSVASHNVRDEINFALGLGLNVLAVHLNKTELPPGLGMRMAQCPVILKYELDDADFYPKLVSLLADILRGEGKVRVPRPPFKYKKMLPALFGFLGGITIMALVAVYLSLNPSESLEPKPMNPLPPSNSINSQFSPTNTISEVSSNLEYSLTSTVEPSAQSNSPYHWLRVHSGDFLDRDEIIGLAIDPRDATILYAVTREVGLYKTVDSGMSWQYVDIPGLRSGIFSIWIDPSEHQTLNLLTSSGVYKSQDGGTGWITLKDGLPNHQWFYNAKIIIDPNDSQHLILSSNMGIYTSINGGASWQIHYEGGCPVMNHTLNIDPADTNIWYVDHIYDDGCQQGFYKSKDGGLTWDLKREFEYGDDAEQLLVEEGRDNKVYIYTIEYKKENNLGKLIISEDQGENWSVYPGKDIRTLSADTHAGILAHTAPNWLLLFENGLAMKTIPLSGMHRVIIGASGNAEVIAAAGIENADSNSSDTLDLLISQNGGKTFELRMNGLGSACHEMIFSPYTSTAYLAGGCSNSNSSDTYYSLDEGQNWIQFQKLQATTFHDIRYLFFDADGAKIYATSRNQLLYSTVNNIDNWALKKQPVNLLYYSTNAGYAADPLQPNLVYYLGEDASENPVMYLSYDGGESWDLSHPVSLPLDAISWMPRIYFNSDRDRGFIINDEIVISSKDHGKTWQECGDPGAFPGTSRTSFIMDPENSSHLFLATLGGGVKTSLDACKTWQNSSQGLANLTVTSLILHPENPQTLFAGTRNGVYRSENGGQTWQEISEGLLGTPLVYSLAMHPTNFSVYAFLPGGLFKLENK